MSQRNNARNHVLTEDELRQVFLKARETPYPFGPIVQVLILTGQRRGEVASMRRSWLDGDGYMTFPEGFTKNKREHRFPMSKMAQEILASLPKTGDWYFPATGSTEKPFNGWGKCKAAGVSVKRVWMPNLTMSALYPPRSPPHLCHHTRQDWHPYPYH